VIQKAGSGDPVKVQNDLNAVQTAMSTFATDSKAGYPHQISSLTSKPIAAVDRLIDSTAISANQVTTWNGPYLGATVSPLAADSVPTGYTAFIMNMLDRYDAVNNVPEHNAAGQDSSGFSATSTLFVGVQLHHHVVAVGQRVGADVGGDGDDGTAGAAEQPGLGVGRHPAVQTAHGATGVVEEDIGLCDIKVQPVIGEVAGAVRT